MSASVQPLRILGLTRPEFRKLVRDLVHELLEEPDMQERLREAGYNVWPRLTIIPRGKSPGP